MKIFIIVAAVMAAIAAAAVAVPLLRKRPSRIVGVIAAVIISGSAAALYPLWSNWDWQVAENAAAEAAAHEQAVRDPAVLAMVAKLEQHLKDEPNDQKGWLMMGRSYVALERSDDAVAAFEHAYSLGKTPEAALGLGEALSMRAGGEITQQASNLFEEAISLAPDDPKALFYGGFAAAVRGDTALARQRWLALKDLHPPPQIEQMLEARIAELGPVQAAPAPAGTIPSGTNSSAGGTNASAAASATAQVNVNISIAPALKARATSGAPLFVFAREPGGTGAPLAAKRLTTAAIGTQVNLSAADSMIPGHVLSSGQQVSITARVSFSGQPIPAAGDLYGEAAYQVGSGGTLNLVIDRVAQ
jgi:cytochrome c-type biogenesis protein CcmH